MLIHSITINNFRAIEQLELENIPDSGVIVIHGDNEKGKSSILEAIQIVLTEKHGARNKLTRAVKPVDRDVPVRISLELSVGPYRMIITKQFLKSPSSELQILEPRSANYTSREADAQLDEILEGHLDRFLLDTLFMRQGDVDAGINAVGIPSLTSALNDQNGGTAEDGAEDTALMAAVEAEYATYFTKRGSRTTSYEQFFTAVEQHQKELDEARAEISTLGAQVDRVARLEQDRDLAQKKLPEAEAELEVRQTEFEAAVKVKAQAEDVDKRLERATTDHRLAEKQQADRADLRARAEKSRLVVEEQHAKVAQATEAAEQEKNTITERSNALEQARAEEATAIEAVKAARKVVDTLSQSARWLELKELINSIDELDQQLLELRTTQAAEATVTTADVDALQKITEEVKVNRALSQSRGAHIRFTAEQSAELMIDSEAHTVDSAGHTVDLDRELTIEVGGVTMVVNPGKMITDSQVQLESAEADRAELLDKLNVDSMEELRGRLAVQQKLTADIEALVKDRARIAGGAPTDIDTLRAEHAALESRNTDDLGDLTLDQARTQLTEAEAHRDQAGEAVKLADASLDALRQQPADRALTVLSTQLEGLSDNAAATLSDVQRAEEDLSDADISAAVSRCQEDLEALKQEKKQIDALLAQSDPVMAEQLLRGAEANVEAYRSAISGAAVELARLESHIQLAAGASERHAKAHAALEAAENRLASIQRRANAAQRLREVMIRHRESSRKRYAAPFADKLARLAARVFGEETGFGLDDQLSIATRSIGSRTVNLDHLSGGAQEQLAILTRFAIADLVADSSTHGVVPVFIDDALGSTDPVRLTRISTLFGEAGRDGQVFVLTCVPERYNYVSPKIMYDIDSLKSRV